MKDKSILKHERERHIYLVDLLKLAKTVEHHPNRVPQDVLDKLDAMGLIEEE